MEKQVSEQEASFLEILREWSGKDDYRMVIEFQSGAWEISLQAVINGKDCRARGVGETFDQAWDNVNPSWA